MDVLIGLQLTPLSETGQSWLFRVRCFVYEPPECVAHGEVGHQMSGQGAARENTTLRSPSLKTAKPS